MNDLKTTLINNISEILEVEPSELNENSDFRKDVPFWDSLKGFALLALLEDEYHTTMSVEEFLEANTIMDLYNKIKK
jgi:acyl carrier protein